MHSLKKNQNAPRPSVTTSRMKENYCVQTLDVKVSKLQQFIVILHF